MTPIEQALLLATDLRPYYARAISSLTPVESERVIVGGEPTIAVDDRWRLYYHPAFLAKISLQEAAAVIAGHEIEHLLRDHSGRRGDRHPRAWNVAGDLEINDDCELQLPPNGVYPKSFQLPDGQTAEWYFEQFPKAECSCGSGAGGERGEWELGPDGGIEPLSGQAIREAVAEDVRHHEASQPGSVPAGIVLWANNLGEKPHIPWHKLLAAKLGDLRRISRGRSDYSWSRPARRVSAILRPGTVDHPPTVAILADTSGSMGEMGSVVIGATREIVRRSGAKTVQCDVAASRHTGKWIGGGGTDLRVGLEATAKLRPQLTIVISDGETPWPADYSGGRCVLLLTNDRSPETPPWMEVIRCLPRRI